MKREKVAQVQAYLERLQLDGWLLYDFHKNNALAHRFLEISAATMTSRRFLYWIPARGTPVQIVHAIEDQVLNLWPGEKKVYSSWQTLEAAIRSVLTGSQRIAMEYSPNNAIPYLSKVDAGTVDFIRSCGVEVVSSGDFLLHFTSVLSDEQLNSQRRAAQALSEIVSGAYTWIKEGIKRGVSERAVQKWIQDQFILRGLETDGGPIVAVNAHSADPHYLTPEVGSSVICAGDFVLIDLWAKERGEATVYGDITRVGVIGEPTAKQQQIFQLVRQAQRAGIDLVRTRFATKQAIYGWEVDEAVRSVIRAAGFEKYFVHRTGHNIEIDLHGSGTHMDNLESHDERPLVPMTCFSVEPGIYLPGEFGVRLESDVLIHADGFVEVTGGEMDVLS